MISQKYTLSINLIIEVIFTYGIYILNKYMYNYLVYDLLIDMNMEIAIFMYTINI